MRFVLKSGIGTSLVSMRNTLAPLALGVVSTVTQVGYFRAAQAPITAFEALSAPVRLILLTEQTHDVERGRIAETYRSLRRYVVGATVVALALAPIAWVLMPWLVAVVLGTRLRSGDRRRPDPARGRLPATRARLDEVVPGLDRQAGPPDRRPRRSRSWCCCRCRRSSASRWGATGAAVAVLVATIAFAAPGPCSSLRLRREHRGAALTDAEMLAP